MKIIGLFVLAAAVALSGCGRAEKNEAAQLAKVLKQKQPDFASAAEVEKDFVQKGRDWTEQIQNNGAGKGPQLDENAAVATQLAESAVKISEHLGQVRQAVYDQQIKNEYAQNIRLALITELTNRQRSLQELRALLQGAAPEFLSYKKSATYKGDTYPGGVAKVASILSSYKSQLDTVGDAIKDLKAKYSLEDSEI